MEMELSLGVATSLFLLSVISVVALSLLSRKRLAAASGKKKKKLGRPAPGPWRLPLVGNLHQIVTSKLPVVLRDLAEKHGPVMCLRLGQVDTIIISSPSAAQEVLREKDLNFASRPSLLVSEVMLYGNLDIGFAPYGAYWRTLRKLCRMELLSERKVRHFMPVRESETLALVRAVHEAGQGGKRPVNLALLLVSCSNAITEQTAFGQVAGRELQEQLLAAINVGMTISSGFSFGDLFPGLGFMDTVTGLTRRLWQARRQMDAVLDKIIAKSEQKGDDLLSVMLRIRDGGDPEFPIETTTIKAIIVDMFSGGTDTTATAAEWVMSELVRNPPAMAKVQAEVRRTFDGKTPQEHEGHIHELHYMRMVIKESMRLNPVLPLLVPRICRETCHVGGFEIVEGSRLMVNSWAIGRSPESWDDPDEFRPERFEDSMADDKGPRFDYLPFGGGRRMCPGSTFGLAVLELIMARLLYYFDWSLPTGGTELDMDMTVGITARRKNQLHVVALPYKEVPLQS